MMPKSAFKILGIFLSLLIPSFGFAQGFTEYGRVLGGVSKRSGSPVLKAPEIGLNKVDNGNTSSKGSHGKSGSSSLPAAVTVISKEAQLYARHDEHADKIAQLSEGEKLLPIVQADAGKNPWYMVKTEAGMTGWVKASDVRQEADQKK